MQDSFTGLNQISPLQANISLRPSIYNITYSKILTTGLYYIFLMDAINFADEPQEFEIEVRPSNNYPIDLYLLMDLSYSMRDDLAKLKTLGAQLCKYIYIYQKGSIYIV